MLCGKTHASVIHVVQKTCVCDSSELITTNPLRLLIQCSILLLYILESQHDTFTSGFGGMNNVHMATLYGGVDHCDEYISMMRLASVCPLRSAPCELE